MRRWLIIPAMLLPFLLWYDCNFRIRVRTVEFSHADVQREIRIAHISDLYGLNWGNNNRVIVETIARLEPDLICVSGTLYADGDESGRFIAGQLLSSLRRIAPVFSALENAAAMLGVSRTDFPTFHDPAGLGNAESRLFRPPEIRFMILKPKQSKSRDAQAPRLLFTALPGNSSPPARERISAHPDSG